MRSSSPAQDAWSNVTRTRVIGTHRSIDRWITTNQSLITSDLPCHDPVNALSGNLLELQKKLKGGRVLSPLIFGELGLGDAQELGELRLTHLETADLPDSPAESL